MESYSQAAQIYPKPKQIQKQQQKKPNTKQNKKNQQQQKTTNTAAALTAHWRPASLEFLNWKCAMSVLYSHSLSL